MINHSERDSKGIRFSSKLGFVMAAAGSAVGIGNIWSFPTLAADNGGGAFLLVYLIFVFFLGYPMLVAEILIGRYGKKDPVTALLKTSRGSFSKSIAWLVGVSSVLVGFFILSFYAIVAGWFFAFALDPFAKLFELDQVSFWLTDFSSPVSRNLVFTFLFSALTFWVVREGIQEGIEKWSKRLMPLLFLLLLVLASYIMSLPGALEGLKYYLIPDVDKLLNKDVLLSALGQSFFSLSLGAAVMMVYGAYLGSKESVPKLAAQVALLDTLVAFLAGLLIIPAIYVAQFQGIQIFTTEGLLIDSDQLVFSVLPALFDTMGGARYVVAPFFYLLMIVAALTSSISMLEAPVSFLMSRTKLSRSRSVSFVSSLCFLVSLLIIFNFESLFSSVITVSTRYAQPLTSLGVTLFVAWVWKRNEVLKELSSNNLEFNQSFFWKIWPWYLKIVCPILVLVVIIQSF